MYPLKFQPIFQKRLWGGQRLRTVLGKSLSGELRGVPIGESWELADLAPGTVKADSAGGASDGSLSSIITNGTFAGKSLHQVWNSEFRVQNSEYFPLLVKFLDAQTNLSVQVHPDAAHCAANPGTHLKNEAWYILYAEPGAKIYKGLKPGVTRDNFRHALQTGEIEPLLNAIHVRAGDCHYLPSGTVHALGAGILAAEVQTPSDTTFRVFDWNRLGPDGKPRQLHVEQALSCIQFADSPNAAAPVTASVPLVTCDHFTIDRAALAASAEREIPTDDTAIWIILDGQGVIQCADSGPTAFTRGDTLLLPASMKKARVKTVATSAWLEVRMPESAAKKS